MKKRDKFILGGIILVALSKIPTLQSQQFDLAGLLGLIIMGGIVGYIAFVISEKVFKKKNEKK